MNAADEFTSVIGSRICEAVSKFLIPLQTSRVLKQSAFEELMASANELARRLKGNDLVPKLLLNELYRTIQVLRNEAPFFNSEGTRLEEMANQLEMTFGLILIGESHEDRVPGVPRIL